MMKALRMAMKNPAVVAGAVIVLDQVAGRVLVGMSFSRKISDTLVRTLGGNRTMLKGGTK